MVIALLTLALLAYKTFQPKSVTNDSTASVITDISTATNSTSTNIDDIPPTYVDLESESLTTSVPAVKPLLSTKPAAPSFNCDGRKHCSQMTSCAEATYFSNNCPGTKMDGNHDGVPCEKQWCN